MQDRQALFAERLESFSPAPWEMIPDFGLYMDQVVTFVERQCQSLFMEGERVFTPAMVNNYVKFGLVDRPVDKKYGRDQLAQVMMICVLKQAASTDAMKALLKPPEGQTLQQHYENFCQTERAIFSALAEALPLPSPMVCAVQGAAYLFLCNALLAKRPEPKPDPRHAPKPAEKPTDKSPAPQAELPASAPASTADASPAQAAAPATGDAAEASAPPQAIPPATSAAEGLAK